MGVLKVSLVAAASSASDEEATNKLLNPVVNEEAEGANSRRIGCFSFSRSMRVFLKNVSNVLAIQFCGREFNDKQQSCNFLAVL